MPPNDGPCPGPLGMPQPAKRPGTCRQWPPRQAQMGCAPWRAAMPAGATAVPAASSGSNGAGAATPLGSRPIQARRPPCRLRP
eukprot:3988129-Lingulodinium_polyedra.AAC.1